MEPSSRPDNDATDRTDHRADQSQVRRHAIKLLARRDHARRELAHKLEIRGYDTHLIEQVLDDLVAGGTLDEGRFAAGVVRIRAERGQGPLRIRRVLEEHGLDGALIDRHLREALVDWNQLAQAARRKRFGTARPTSFRDRSRQVRFLEYRGFTAGQIRAALDAEWD